jgi:hypothetical protein
MYVFCKLFNGTTRYMDINNNMTFGQLKDKLYECEGVPKKLIRLTYQCKIYPDITKLINVGIISDDSIYMHIRNNGTCEQCI